MRLRLQQYFRVLSAPGTLKEVIPMDGCHPTGFSENVIHDPTADDSTLEQAVDLLEFETSNLAEMHLFRQKFRNSNSNSNSNVWKLIIRGVLYLQFEWHGPLKSCC